MLEALPQLSVDAFNVLKPRANFSLCEREKDEKCLQSFDSEASGGDATFKA